jgi:hypothetical protein
MRKLKVLIGMEYSGRSRDAFLAAGHDAMSCDLLETDVPGPHYKGDVRDVLHAGWDLAIFHPDCTYLCGSGIHWNKREGHVRFGGADTAAALSFVRSLLLEQDQIPFIALENPVGIISTNIMPASQYVQPYEFGDDASKKTGLWTRNLPRLVANPAERVAGRIVEWPRGSGKMVERWANQTDSGQNKLGPSDDRWKLRAETYPGIARAFTQWADHINAVYDLL